MSSRADWSELVDEIFFKHGIDLMAVDAPLDWIRDFRWRLEADLHNAFVAGQEQSAKAPECEGMPINEELMHLRAFKQQWATNDGNSPGYSFDKMMNYRNQAAIFKRLYLAWRSASMTPKALTSVSIHGAGNKAFAAARKLEKESVNKCPGIFPEDIAKDPVNKMDPIHEANMRAREEMKQGPTPFHDKYFMGKTPVCDLTTEQLEAEVARRKGEGPFQKMFVMVRVIGTLSNGVKKDFLHWGYDNIDPESFTAQHNADFLDLKVKRLPK